LFAIAQSKKKIPRTTKTDFGVISAAVKLELHSQSNSHFCDFPCFKYFALQR